ncbi:S8 family serine peptidase [Kribbella sp. NBC_01245]|uniref:S8 family serine peptidase n=1 Tax=Kribbella sp. NBC_01245 TaxID=2903578 RepID=UPI002E295ED2|nr:S8 family serine peptidase [Kribbella sp. NBC_01245]
MKLRRSLFAGALALATLTAAVTVPAQAAPSPDPAVSQLIEQAEEEGPQRVIVRLATVAAQQPVLDNLEDSNAESDVNYQYKLFPLLALDADEQALRELDADPRVISIQEDKEEHATLGNSIPWINADQAQGFGFSGDGQAVAILDTGIDRDHPFFAGRLVSEACYSSVEDSDEQTSLCPNGAASQLGAGAADAETAACTGTLCDHGTHVAGIAAGNGTGVTGAPGNGVAAAADIIAIQVFHRNDVADRCAPAAAPCVTAYQSDQVRGLERVLALNATIDIAAANISIGGSVQNMTACDTDVRKDPIDDLLGVGIATVIAAGNSGFTTGVAAPGCISTAVTVGGTQDNSDALYLNGNRGSLLDLMAPGQNIQSSIPDDTFGNMTGTSMAAPHVAGAFAVLRAAYPNATHATLLGYLRDTGVDVSYTSGTSTVTTPRIDMLAALRAGNADPSITVDSPSVTVNEGSTATMTGSFADADSTTLTLGASVGTITTTGPGRWKWTYDTSDGPTQSRTVSVTVSDDLGEGAGRDFSLVVNNVAPSAGIAPGQATSVTEGGLFSVRATFSDPGWADTYTALIDWGDGSSGPAPATVTTQGPPADLGEVTGSHRYADNGTYTVKVTVTDDDGGSTSASFAVQVSNVAPATTIDPGQVKTINEGTVLTAKASFVDPGWADTYTALLTWGTGETSPVTPLITQDGPPVDRGEVTGSHAYGDNGSFGVGVKVTDDDGGTSTGSFTVVVNNVAPTATIDETGAVNVNGVPTFIAHQGQPVTFAGRSTDPGSDDLTLSWSWGDGPPVPDVVTPYLVNPPGTDPAVSPSLQPRDVTDTKSHTFGGACSYEVGFGATDDDAGASSDTAKVVITGNAHLTRIAPLWHLQTRPGPRLPLVDLPVATVNCYLQVAQHMSRVLSEVTDVSTMAKAHALLGLTLLNPKRELDRQILTAWLNFADGSFDLSTAVDTNLDLKKDSTFGAVMANAETIRLNPASTNAQLRSQVLLLEKLNLLGS